jgi:hypothetical protein
MGSIDFYGLNQVGNQIMPPFELHINRVPGILHFIAAANEPIIKPDGKKDDDNENTKTNED